MLTWFTETVWPVIWLPTTTFCLYVFVYVPIANWQYNKARRAVNVSNGKRFQKDTSVRLGNTDIGSSSESVRRSLCINLKGYRSAYSAVLNWRIMFWLALLGFTLSAFLTAGFESSPHLPDQFQLIHGFFIALIILNIHFTAKEFKKQMTGYAFMTSDQPYALVFTDECFVCNYPDVGPVGAIRWDDISEINLVFRSSWERGFTLTLKKSEKRTYSSRHLAIDFIDLVEALEQFWGRQIEHGLKPGF